MKQGTIIKLLIGIPSIIIAAISLGLNLNGSGQTPTNTKETYVYRTIEKSIPSQPRETSQIAQFKDISSTEENDEEYVSSTESIRGYAITLPDHTNTHDASSRRSGFSSETVGVGVYERIATKTLESADMVRKSLDEVNSLGSSQENDFIKKQDLSNAIQAISYIEDNKDYIISLSSSNPVYNEALGYINMKNDIIKQLSTLER